jgi:hypothetical protein
VSDIWADKEFFAYGINDLVLNHELHKRALMERTHLGTAPIHCKADGCAEIARALWFFCSTECRDRFLGFFPADPNNKIPELVPIDDPA